MEKKKTEAARTFQTKRKKPDPPLEAAYKILGRVPKLSQGECIALRRTQGLTVDELKPDQKCLFFSLFPADYEMPIVDPYILNCILFAVQMACAQNGTLTSKTKLQYVMSDVYNSAKSRSMMVRIEAFMAEDGRYNEMFFKNLSWLTQVTLRRQGDKTINVFALVADLICWDTTGRDNWLRSIVRIKKIRMMQEEGEEEEETEEIEETAEETVEEVDEEEKTHEQNTT